jgi:hypothetical protein
LKTTLIYSESQSKSDEWVVPDTGVDVHSKEVEEEEERTIVDDVVGARRLVRHLERAKVDALLAGVDLGIEVDAWPR